MRNRRRLLSDHEGTREIWPAFTDVMSTLALILFVLVLLAYVRSLITSKRLEAFQRQIDDSEQQLRALHAQIQAGRAELSASQHKLGEQQGVIAESHRQLDSLRAQLDSIAVLRVAVLNKLKQAIEAQLGTSNEGGVEVVKLPRRAGVLRTPTVEDWSPPACLALATPPGSVERRDSEASTPASRDRRHSQPAGWSIWCGGKRGSTALATRFFRREGKRRLLSPHWSSENRDCLHMSERLRVSP